MKVFFVSLGCDKNKVDSEKILKFLIKKDKVSVVDSPYGSDVAIINTCSFIRDAKNESIKYLKFLISLKKLGQIKKIMMLGCLSTEICKSKNCYYDFIKDIDIVLPLEKYVKDLDCINDRVSDILSFSSFIKICDGCDKFCSYCIIPYLRGRFRSVPIENLIIEAKKLAKSGVKELSIVGQDTLNYGIDIYKKNSFKELIGSISKINGIEWIRLLYCYPEEIDDDVITLIKENKKVLPYIDMPVQHVSDKILKSMNRKTTKDNIKRTVYKLRSEIPEIVIRTTIMVGFPGETEDDFNELCDFIKEMHFDKLGVFCYSKERLSKSYSFKNQVSETVKIARMKKLMAIQKNIATEINKTKIGVAYNSIVEGFDTKKRMYVVRPYFNARGIDDNVYIKTTEKLISGDFVNVLIKEVRGMDLIGVLI